MKGKELDSWDEFTGSNFLSADDVKDDNQVFVCTGTEMDLENVRPMLLLESNENKYKFSLNVTNSKFVKDAGVENPKSMVGKQLTFKIVMVNNPKLNKEVEGLRIRTIK
jgi:cell division ATPase FtsA|tara:strand:- start:47 stop:373 length:327 start_codon:yes stop_codon:yes gene_type:complete